MHESRCGILCSQCTKKEEYGCEGCINMPEGYWGGKCEIKICCEMKKIEHCGLCEDFPCQMIKEISYDPETGDNGDRLLNCKMWLDKSTDDKWSVYRKILLGVSIGITAGLIIGILQSMLTAWLIVGFIVGFGLGLMFHISRKNN